MIRETENSTEVLLNWLNILKGAQRRKNGVKGLKYSIYPSKSQKEWNKGKGFIEDSLRTEKNMCFHTEKIKLQKKLIKNSAHDRNLRTIQVRGKGEEGT